MAKSQHLSCTHTKTVNSPHLPLFPTLFSLPSHLPSFFLVCLSRLHRNSYEVFPSSSYVFSSLHIHIDLAVCLIWPSYFVFLWRISSHFPEVWLCVSKSMRQHLVPSGALVIRAFAAPDWAVVFLHPAGIGEVKLICLHQALFRAGTSGCMCMQKQPLHVSY